MNLKYYPKKLNLIDVIEVLLNWSDGILKEEEICVRDFLMQKLSDSLMVSY